MSDYKLGIYEAITRVRIRREPRIIPTNIVGVLDIGTQRQIFSIVTDGKNYTWGRISEADSAGIAQWTCIKGLNRTYMKLIEPMREVDFLSRLENLEAWARTKGYTG